MSASITPASVHQLARLAKLLEKHGIGSDQIQLLLDDAARRNLVVQAWLGQEAAQLPKEFNQAAIVRFIDQLFRRDINRLESLAIPPGYTLNQGYRPMYLASPKIFRQLLEGLGPLHSEVAILRLGLIDGKELSTASTAKRLRITVEEVNRMRSQVGEHVKARQRALYPFSSIVRKGSISQQASGTPIGELQLPPKAAVSLKRAGITTIEQLTTKSAAELSSVSNFGVKSLASVHAALERRGLNLRPD